MDFKEWMNSDQVIARIDKFGNKFFSTQDANYHNKIYGVNNLLIYYKKEFIKEYNKDYKTCDRCCFDIVDDDGDIMEHICIDDKLY